jgi:flagellar biosynthetic protein FlhB
MLLSSAGLLWFLGRFFMQQVMDVLSQSLGHFVAPAARDGDLFAPALFAIKKAALLVLPPVAILAVMSVASTVLQVGLLNNEEALELNFDRLNPVNGLMRLFSLKALVEGLKALAKLAMVVAVAALVVRSRLVAVPALIDMTVGQIFEFAGDMALRLIAGVGVFMAALAAGDYFFQWWDLEKQMRMTKQEIKEEHKSREGDPMIKARIRRIQREMANKRMMADVPKADVVVTNPTHVAVALRYDAATMASPKVVAKGSGLIAAKIKEVARESGVPVIENKPLARAIFKALKIGQSVPRELFTAVAQVLSYVYKLKRKRLA